MASGKRNWMFVVWKDSCPDDFEKRLDALHVPCCYILHDQDKMDDGTLKKPHWQGLIMLDGPMPYNKVLEMMKGVAEDGINTVEPCISKYGSLLYLIHANNPEKHEYEAKEVKSINGADYFHDILAADDPMKYDMDIKIFIDKNNITQYYDLSRIATFFYPEWQRTIDTQALRWTKYLISKEDKQNNKVWTEFDYLIDEVVQNGN